MKNKLKKYTLGLDVAGKISFVLTIYDTNLRRAKKEWSRLTGHNDGGMWDKRRQTYSGWHIVETTEIPMQRKSNPNPFQY